MTITDAIHQAVLAAPAPAWTPAVEHGGEIRDGSRVAEPDGDCVDGGPTGMRLIIRKERPHPEAQLRLTDADGLRLTCFATNTPGIPIAELELRHGQRARAEDRIRSARATGLRNLPLHDAAQNQIWLDIIQIASTCWPGCPPSPYQLPTDGPTGKLALPVLRAVIARPVIRHQASSTTKSC